MSRSDNTSSSSVAASSNSDSSSHDSDMGNCRQEWRKIKEEKTWYPTPPFHGNNLYGFLVNEFGLGIIEPQDFVFSEEKNKSFTGKVIFSSKKLYPSGFICWNEDSENIMQKIELWCNKFHPGKNNNFNSHSPVSSNFHSSSRNNCWEQWRGITQEKKWYFTDKFTGLNFYRFLNQTFNQNITIYDFVFNEIEDKLFNGTNILSSKKYPSGFIYLKENTLNGRKKIDIWNEILHPKLKLTNNLSSVVIKNSTSLLSKSMLKEYFETIQFFWDPLNNSCQWVSIGAFFGEYFNEVIVHMNFFLKNIDFRWSEKKLQDSKGEIIKSKKDYGNGFFRIVAVDNIEIQYKINCWNAFFLKDNSSEFFSTIKFKWTTANSSDWLWCPIFFRGSQLDKFIQPAENLISLRNIYWGESEYSISPQPISINSNSLYSPGWICLVERDEENCKSLIGNWNTILASSLHSQNYPSSTVSSSFSSLLTFSAMPYIPKFLSRLKKVKNIKNNQKRNSKKSKQSSPWLQIDTENKWYFITPFTGGNFQRFLNEKFNKNNIKQINPDDFECDDGKKIITIKSYGKYSNRIRLIGYDPEDAAKKIIIWNKVLHPQLVQNNNSALPSSSSSSSSSALSSSLTSTHTDFIEEKSYKKSKKRKKNEEENIQNTKKINSGIAHFSDHHSNMNSSSCPSLASTSCTLFASSSRHIQSHEGVTNIFDSAVPPWPGPFGSKEEKNEINNNNNFNSYPLFFNGVTLPPESQTLDESSSGNASSFDPDTFFN